MAGCRLQIPQSIESRSQTPPAPANAESAIPCTGRTATELPRCRRWPCGFHPRACTWRSRMRRPDVQCPYCGSHFILATDRADDMRRLTVVQLIPALESGGVELPRRDLRSAGGSRAPLPGGLRRWAPALRLAGHRCRTRDAGHRPQIAADPASYAGAAEAVRRGARRHRARTLAPAGLAGPEGSAGHRCRATSSFRHHHARAQFAWPLQRGDGAWRARHLCVRNRA